jgi:hypothetical protein
MIFWVARTIYCPGGEAERSHKKPPKIYFLITGLLLVRARADCANPDNELSGLPKGAMPNELTGDFQQTSSPRSA